MTVADLYERRAAEESDIQAHMPVLRDLAAQCEHVTEFGVRYGFSTVAFLAGLPAGGRLVSYDIDPFVPTPPEVDGHPAWTFVAADTSRLELMAPTDLLFLDSLHDSAQVDAELRWALLVRRWLVFHDVTLFGAVDESTGEPPGILHAVFGFMADNPEWRVISHDWRSCGLLVLERTR